MEDGKRDGLRRRHCTGVLGLTVLVFSASTRRTCRHGSGVDMSNLEVMLNHIADSSHMIGCQTHSAGPNIPTNRPTKQYAHHRSSNPRQS